MVRREQYRFLTEEPVHRIQEDDHFAAASLSPRLPDDLDRSIGISVETTTMSQAMPIIMSPGREHTGESKPSFIDTFSLKKASAPPTL